MSAKSDTRCTLHGDGKLALCINHQLRQLRDGPEHCMLHESCDRSVLGLGCPIEVGSDIRCRYVSRTAYQLSGGQNWNARRRSESTTRPVKIRRPSFDFAARPPSDTYTGPVPILSGKIHQQRRKVPSWSQTYFGPPVGQLQEQSDKSASRMIFSRQATRADTHTYSTKLV